MIKPGYYYAIGGIYIWSPYGDNWLYDVADYCIKVTLKREVYA
tara:strand:+ start:513 stop:641 length:129 start_codon:yes stop_codon:yes gene_type:complete